MLNPDIKRDFHTPDYSHFIPPLGPNPPKDKVLLDGLTGVFCVLLADRLKMRPLSHDEGSTFKGLIAQAGKNRPVNDDDNYRPSIFVSTLWGMAATKAIRMERFQKGLNSRKNGEQDWTEIILGSADIPRMNDLPEIYNPRDVARKSDYLTLLAERIWKEKLEPDYDITSQLRIAKALLPIWWDKSPTSKYGLCDLETRSDVSEISARRFNDSIRRFTSGLFSR